MQERLNYLRNRYPNLRIAHGRPEISKKREVKLTNLGTERFPENLVDAGILIKMLKRYSIRYPQFKTIKLAFYSDGDRDVEINIMGEMLELDADYRLRIVQENEHLELYDLLVEERRILDELREREQLEALKQKYEREETYDMDNERHPFPPQEHIRATEEYMGFRLSTF